MTRTDFTNYLVRNHIDYYLDNNDNIVISDRNYHLDFDMVDLPENVIFKNSGYVLYRNAIKVPKGVIFENSGDLYLHNKVNTNSLKEIVKNRGELYPENFNIKLPKIYFTFSDNFQMTLDVTKNDNKISRAIYDIYHNSTVNDLGISYIDVNYDKEDEIYFITIDRLLKEYKKYKKEHQGDNYNLRNFQSNCRSELFNLSKKNSLKIGRFVKKIFKDKFTDSEIEVFVNLWKSYLNDEKYELELVKGEDIRKYYCRDNQDTYEGSCLYNSCYNWATKEDKHKDNDNNLYKQLEFYVKNPNIGLLVLKEKGAEKIKARALTWFSNNGNVLIDHIFYTNQYDRYFYRKYASINNCLMYEQGGYYGKIKVDVPDEAAQVEVIPKYLDCLYYYNNEKIIRTR